MQVVVSVEKGPQTGRDFVFDRHATFVVGRASDASLPLPDDPFISRHHFIIEFNPPVCMFRDLGSTNGTKVNGVRVERVRLNDGDEIVAGGSVFRVRIEETSVWRIRCRGCGQGAPPDLSVSAMPGEGSAAINWYCEPCLVRRRRFPDAPKGFWIEKWLGSGGMGDVFLARREADNRPAALKVMIPIIATSDRAKQYFLREMNVLRDLRHRHIVAFHGAVEIDGQFQLIMEYVDGRGARDWVAALGEPLPVGAAARIGVQLLMALGHAHAKGYVHRDIKPSNLLVMGPPHRPYIKVTDFGLAKNFRDDSGFGGLTLEGDFGGSMGFISPDHIRDFRDVKETADLYSTGATLYYLLTRNYPFLDFDPKRPDALTKLLEHPSVPLRAHRPDAPELLERVLARALEKQPRDRFPSAVAMAAALKPLLAADGSSGGE
jgi:serine/threonine-protein kinase